jgi:hypothetical protein
LNQNIPNVAIKGKEKVTLEAEAFTNVNVTNDVPPLPPCDLAHPSIIRPYEVKEPPQLVTPLTLRSIIFM